METEVKQEITLSPDSIEALASEILNQLLCESHLGLILEDMAAQIKEKRRLAENAKERERILTKISFTEPLTFGMPAKDFIEGYVEEIPGKTIHKATEWKKV